VKIRKQVENASGVELCLVGHMSRSVVVRASAYFVAHLELTRSSETFDLYSVSVLKLTQSCFLVSRYLRGWNLYALA